MLSSPENQQDRARVEALRLQEAVDIAEWAERRVEDAVKYVALENSRKQGAWHFFVFGSSLLHSLPAILIDYPFSHSE